MPQFDINHSLKINDFDKHQKVIDKAIQKYVETENKDLQDLLRISTESGKKLRSNILIAASGTKPSEQVIAACAAIELIHLGSLVHDDDIDEAPTRRGTPTIYAEYGHAKALLVGDIMFACAQKAAADAGAEVAAIMAEACRHMCEGQYLEELDGYNSQRTRTSYEKTVIAKTSSLIIGALKAGAVFNDELPAKQIEKFGIQYGLAFQQLDDLLDILSTKDLLGKPVHQDLKEGVYTGAIIHMLSTKKTSSVVQPYIQVAKNLPYDHDEFVEELYKHGAIKKAVKDIHAALAEVQKIAKDTPPLKGIAKLLEDYISWAIKNQVATEYLKKVN